MAIKSIDDIVRNSGIAQSDEVKLRDALHQLDTNGDGNLDTSEVATQDGYLACNSTTENWLFYTLNPVQNALFKSGLIEKLRGAICPKTYDIPQNTTVGRGFVPDRADAVEILQREYAITRPGSGRSGHLQTFGAGPCVVLTLYDPVTKTGVMAHIDALTDLPQSLGMIAYDLNRFGVDMSKMEARLVGGDSTSQEAVSKLYKEVTGRVSKVVEIDLVRSTPAAVMLDTNTGKLYDYDKTIQTTPRKKLDGVSFIVMMSGPLNRSDAKSVLR